MVVSPKRKTRERKRRWIGERIACFSFRFPGSCFSSVDRIYSTEETSCPWRSEGGGSFCCLPVALEICSSKTRYWHQLEFTSLPILLLEAETLLLDSRVWRQLNYRHCASVMSMWRGWLFSDISLVSITPDSPDSLFSTFKGGSILPPVS